MDGARCLRIPQKWTMSSCKPTFRVLSASTLHIMFCTKIYHDMFFFFLAFLCLTSVFDVPAFVSAVQNVWLSYMLSCCFKSLWIADPLYSKKGKNSLYLLGLFVEILFCFHLHCCILWMNYTGDLFIFIQIALWFLSIIKVASACLPSMSGILMFNCNQNITHLVKVTII